MKKIIASFLFLAVLASAIPAYALTRDEIEAQIAALQAQLAQNQNGGQTTVDNSQNCLVLGQQLQYRSRDSQTNGDVSSLQDFLQSQGYLSSEPTGYFGLVTRRAVIAFQKANGLSANGVADAATRAKINKLSCGGDTTTTTTSLQTYANQSNGISFQYPSTWQVSADGSNSVYSVSKVVGNSSLKLSISTGISGVGGACPDYDPSSVVLASNKVAINGQKLYFIYYGDTSQNKIQYAYLSSSATGECPNVAFVNIPGVSGLVAAQLNLFTNGQKVGLNSGTTFGPADFADAEQILNSLQLSSTGSTTTTTQSNTEPTVTTVGSPTLRLSYDTVGKEASLVAKAVVKVTAGSQNVYLTSNLAYVSLTNPHPEYTPSLNTVSVTSPNRSTVNINSYNVSATPIGSISTFQDSYGVTMYTVPAGQSALFNIRYSVNPKDLFGGSYTALISVDTENSADSRSAGRYFLAGETNSVLVLGETTPFISSVTSPVSTSQSLTISGQRFTGNDVLYIDNQASSWGMVLDSSTQLRYGYLSQLGLSAGQHSLYVYDSTTGKSNTAWFTLTDGSTGTNPSITILSPNGGEVWQNSSTQQYSITWSSNGINPQQLANVVLQFPNGSLCTMGTTPLSNKVFYTILGSQGCTGRTDQIIFPTGQYKVGLTYVDAYGHTVSDYSDTFFTIHNSTNSTASITSVSSPANPISQFYPGDSVTLTGTDLPISASVYIYSNTKDATVNGYGNLNLQSMTFTAPNLPAGTYTLYLGGVNQVQSNSVQVTVLARNVPVPAITSLSAQSAKIGDTITITGTGFTPTGNIVVIGNGVVSNSGFTSSNNTITFTVPSFLTVYCPGNQMCPGAVSAFISGQYSLAVRNANGLSSNVNFTLVNPTLSIIPRTPKYLTADGSAQEILIDSILGNSLVRPDSAKVTITCPANVTVSFNNLGTTNQCGQTLPLNRTSDGNGTFQGIFRFTNGTSNPQSVIMQTTVYGPTGQVMGNGSQTINLPSSKTV